MPARESMSRASAFGLALPSAIMRTCVALQSLAHAPRRSRR